MPPTPSLPVAPRAPLPLRPVAAPAPPPGDAEATRLMACFRDRRAEADFEALYRATRASLLAWIVQLARQRRLALDPFEALQDTYVNVYRYAGGFRDDDPGSFRRWARTIAGNVVRRAARPGSGSFSLGALEGLGQEPADPRPGPAHAADLDERRIATGRALGLLLLHYARAHAQLSPRDREALRLVEVEGLDYRTVGARLGTRPSNTKMIVFRARQRLRARMALALDGPVAARLAG